MYGDKHYRTSTVGVRWDGVDVVDVVCYNVGQSMYGDKHYRQFQC